MSSQKKSIFSNPTAVVLLAVFCNLLWGSAFPFIKIGYQLFQLPNDDFFTKLVFAGLRFLIAGVLTLGSSFIINKKAPRLPKQALPGVTLLGLVQTTTQYIFYYWGVAHISGVRSSIINSTSTFFAILLAHFFLQGTDRMNRNKIIGCLIGFAGVVLVSADSTLGGAATLSGDGAIAMAAFCFASGSLISKKLTRNYDGISVTGWNLLIGGTVLCTIGLAGGGRLVVITLPGIAVLLYLSVLSALAFTIWALLLQRNPMGKISVYNFLIPVFGALLSALLLNESLLNPKYLVALVMVCGGIFLVNRPLSPNIKQTSTGK